jgi:hypothetical protein
LACSTRVSATFIAELALRKPRYLSIPSLQLSPTTPSIETDDRQKSLADYFFPLDKIEVDVLAGPLWRAFFHCRKKDQPVRCLRSTSAHRYKKRRSSGTTG